MPSFYILFILEFWDMAIISWIDNPSILEWSQIGKNNYIYNTTYIEKLNQIENNFYLSWEEFVSKKEFSEILKIIRFIMSQDTDTISKMQLKIKEMDEEIKKLKALLNR